MYGNEVVAEAQKLRAQGLSLRQIGKRLGIHRGTAKTLCALNVHARRFSVTRGATFNRWWKSTTYLRCSGCGNRVKQPCAICAAREHRTVF